MSEVKCIVCRTQYKYCPKCGHDKNEEPWKALYCSANCKDIYHVCEEFAFGRMTADAARNQLNRLDMSVKNKLHGGLAKNVADIFAATNNRSFKKTFVKPEVVEEKETTILNDDLLTAKETEIKTEEEE